MRLSLPAVSAANVPVAQGPEINLESSVRISPVDLIKLGEVRTDAAGVADWYAQAGVSVPAGGLDLHLHSDQALENLAGNPSVTLTTTLTGAVSATSRATIVVPSWVPDQTKNWGQDESVDFTGVGSGNSLLLVTAIADLSASSNLPANAVFSVWGSPVAESFVFYGFKRSADGPAKTPKFVHIADKYDSAASVKKGRSGDAVLKLDMVHISDMSGISRYNGRKVAVMIDVKKNGVVQTGRLIYTGYGVSAGTPRGDGDGEVMDTSSGPFECLLSFTAP